MSGIGNGIAGRGDLVGQGGMTLVFWGVGQWGNDRACGGISAREIG